MIHSSYLVAVLRQGPRGSLQPLGLKMKRQLFVYPALVFSSLFSPVPDEQGSRFLPFVGKIGYGWHKSLLAMIDGDGGFISLEGKVFAD